MSGFTGADDLETLPRKRRYTADAPAYWPLLTRFNESTTKNQRRLVTVAELDRYGIERVPADVFHWGGYRCSKACDAIPAKRSAES